MPPLNAPPENAGKAGRANEFPDSSGNLRKRSSAHRACGSFHPDPPRHKPAHVSGSLRKWSRRRRACLSRPAYQGIPANAPSLAARGAAGARSTPPDVTGKVPLNRPPSAGWAPG
jgi:hypothetical protein